MLKRPRARAVAVASAVGVTALAASVMTALPASAAGGLDVTYYTTGSTTLTNPNSMVTVNFKPTTMSVHLGDYTPDGNKIRADLPLAPVTAGFKAYGFLPAKGTVVFTQVKPVTGILNLNVNPATVTATAVYVVSLRDVVIGGAKANVGTNCQTIKPVKVAVTSESDFNLAAGTLDGLYDLGKFQDCGGAQNIINDTLPGMGNTLQLHINFGGPPSDDSGSTQAAAKAAYQAARS